MIDYSGWLLDVYPDSEQGAVVWLLGDDGERRRFYQPFPVVFYAAGSHAELRSAWQYLKQQPLRVGLARTTRQDLFKGPLEVMQITVPGAADQPRLFRNLARQFPQLDYYDADIAFPLRFSAWYHTFPLARCHLQSNEANRLQQLEVLDTPWDLDPEPAPIRVLAIEPDCDPAHGRPAYLTLHAGRAKSRLPLGNARAVLIGLNAVLQGYDPDLILTHWGDTWLLPWLLELSEKHHIAFNPNRDPKCEVLQRKEKSFFTYGQIVYRGRQVQLFGRWHVDACNAMMFGDYGLEGVLEQARVTGLPVQTIARNSPGSGITAMQMIMALQKGILVPYQKQQAESFKSAAELINADQGGLVYQPVTGLHRDVGAIDFFSMYPQIMEHFNLSPETVGAIEGEGVTIPALGIAVDQSKRGFVPETLAPLLKKRYMLKEWLLKLDARDCRYKVYKARVTALKWLLVVCFGYLGFKNARFGRIESHQAVTAYGREVLLRAKEAAEDMGFTVLHLYVDSLFVHKPGATRVEDYRPLLDEIIQRTGIPISLDGIYRWVAFLPSRLDERVPVANRYFGVFQDGSTKVRGIELRRGDTCPFIADTQETLLGVLSEALTVDELPLKLEAVAVTFRRAWRRLHTGEIPLEQLLVSQKVSRALAEYRTLSLAARAAAQLERIGKNTRPGQRVRFLYMLGDPGVWAWDLPAAPNRKALDIQRYEVLLIRAASAILQPLGIRETNIREWITASAGYSCAPWRIPASKALPLFFPPAVPSEPLP